jgi:hypothetical protein
VCVYVCMYDLCNVGSAHQKECVLCVFMCMYLCVCVYVYVCVYVCMCMTVWVMSVAFTSRAASVYVCMYTCIHTHV